MHLVKPISMQSGIKPLYFFKELSNNTGRYKRTLYFTLTRLFLTQYINELKSNATR